MSNIAIYLDHIGIEYQIQGLFKEQNRNLEQDAANGSE